MKKLGLRSHFLKFWTTSNTQTRKMGVSPQKMGSEPQKWVPDPQKWCFWPKNGHFWPQNGGTPPKRGVETKCRFLGVKFHGFFLKKTSLKTMVFFRVRPKLCSNPRGTPRNSDRFWPNFDQKMGVFLKVIGFSREWGLQKWPHFWPPRGGQFGPFLTPKWVEPRESAFLTRNRHFYPIWTPKHPKNGSRTPKNGVPGPPKWGGPKKKVAGFSKGVKKRSLKTMVKFLDFLVIFPLKFLEKTNS